MKPWFRKSCDWHRTAAVDELRALLGQQAPLALVIFDSICAWCAENNTASLSGPSVDREVRAWTTNATLGRRLVGALADVGLLVQEGDGYLIDPTITQRQEGDGEGEGPASSRRPRSSTRQDRYRQAHADAIKAKDRARKASRKASAAVTESVTERRGMASRNVTESVTDSTTGVTEGVTESEHSTTFRDTPAPSLSPPDPPPAPAPTPAQAQAQAQAQARAGGAPAAAPVSSSVAEIPEIPPSEAPVSGPRPKAPTKAAKPKAPRALPPRAALAKAYAAGVSAATGAPCSPPSERWELDAIEAMATAHAAGLVGAELLGWVTAVARDFADAKAEDRFTADKGFPPKMARSWLDGGNRPAPRDPGPRPPPPGPKVRPGPGPSHNWLLDDEPPPSRRSAPVDDTSADTVAELTRDLTRGLFAFPADPLAPEVPS